MTGSFFLIGIKGSGMSHLAIILKERKNEVSGCDVDEIFQTDEILLQANIEIFAGFDGERLKNFDTTTCIIYSTAFAQKPIVQQARQQGFRVFSYIEYLTLLSQQRKTYGVAGTHGKTTSTAATAFALSSGRRKEFPFFSLFGSSLVGTNGKPLYQGDENFLLECCEYQDHFQSYALRGMMLTNVEWDHPDYFENYDATIQSFQQRVTSLAQDGFLLYCSDDSGARKVADWARMRRPDLKLYSYGFEALGPFAIHEDGYQGGINVKLAGYRSFHLPFVGRNFVRDLVGAAVFATCILLDRPSPQLYLDENALVVDEAIVTVLSTSLKILESFPGTVGRFQVMAEDDGITYIDDYAHHPTEIDTTIERARKKYPNRKILIVFAPHTSSRTQTFLKYFTASLSQCDKLIVQETYASARGDITETNYAQILAKEVEKRGFRTRRALCGASLFVPGDDDTVASVASSWLQDGDVCITMGAGNNHNLYKKIIDKRHEL